MSREDDALRVLEDAYGTNGLDWAKAGFDLAKEIVRLRATVQRLEHDALGVQAVEAFLKQNARHKVHADHPEPTRHCLIVYDEDGGFRWDPTLSALGHQLLEQGRVTL